jgi:hypothetical protein
MRPKVELTVGEREVICRLYKAHGLQFTRKRTHFGVHLLRRILVEEGFTIRSVGRPRKK